MRGLILEPFMTAVIVLSSGFSSNEAPKTEPLTDEQFLIKAMEASHSEVQRGEIAQKKSDSAEILKFAQHLIQEHDQCRKDLLKQAGDLKVAVVSGLSKEYKDTIDRLSKLEGKDFDREYLTTVIDGHDKTIKLFQAEAKNGAIESLRTHAKKMVPVFQEHRKQAQNLKEKIAKS